MRRQTVEAFRHSSSWFYNQQNPERTSPMYRIGWNYSDTHTQRQTEQAAVYHQLQARSFAHNAMRARDEGDAVLWRLCQEEATLNAGIARNIYRMEG